MKTKTLAAAVGLAFVAAAHAKLPPLDDAAKAKAAETAARSAWQAKVDAYQLCKAQDAVAAKYRKSAGGMVKTAAPAQAKDAKAAAPQPQAAASGTPVASSSALPPCTDPGPFAYNPPEQKPLETSGAHSPSGTAASPPSVKNDAATMAPGKGGVPAAPANAPAAAPAKKS